VNEHGKSIGSIRSDQPEEKAEGIEDRRFEMGPEGDAAKDMGVPVGNRAVDMKFIVEELFYAEVKAYEIISDEPMPANDDISKKVQAETSQ
jgi:hypothetical protein